MAPGTRKDEGYFWIGATGFREIVLCESAIDAMSCFQMHPQRICIFISGVRADPPWLDGLLARGYDIFCGFDADGPGDNAAARMMALHPAVRRLRPPAHDWNDVLTASWQPSPLAASPIDTPGNALATPHAISQKSSLSEHRCGNLSERRRTKAPRARTPPASGAALAGSTPCAARRG